MNYKQIKVNGGVKSFKVQENSEFILTNEGLYLQGNKIDERVETFSLSNDRLIFVKGDTTFLFKKSGAEFIKEIQVNKTVIYQSVSKNDAVFISELNLDDFTLRYEMVEFGTGDTVFEFGRLPISAGIYRNDNVVFLHLENKLTCFKPYNQKSVWEVELENRVKIEKIINVYQDQLLVACSDHLLLSVDINTGGILHQWRELKGFEVGSFYKDVLPEPADFVLDKSASKLIGVFDTYYFEINLDSKEISYHQLEDELSKFGIRSFRPFFNNPFTSDHLYLTGHTFLDEVPDVDLSSVLALNRNTKKVDWVHIFKDTGLGTNVPQITSTHLYQLDIEGNLYVFERIA